MLVELLQPAGPDLARRWLAALLSIPRDERLAAVEAIEHRIATLYAHHDATLNPTDHPSAEPAAHPGDREIHVISPPTQRDGYTEHTETTYSTTKRPAAPAPKRAARTSR